MNLGTVEPPSARFRMSSRSQSCPSDFTPRTRVLYDKVRETT